MIRKLTQEQNKIHLTIDLKLDAKAFKNLSQARDFIMQNQNGIENIVNKYARAKVSSTPLEINNDKDRAIIGALRRLGIL